MYHKNFIEKVTYWSGVVIIGSILGASLQLASAWVSPPNNPPAQNVGGPITTGAASQYKEGSLGVGISRVPADTIEADGVISSLKGGTYGKGAFKMSYHTLNSHDNGWLYIGDQNNNVYGSRGLAADSLWANYRMYTPTLCLSGDCRSAWPSGGGSSGISKACNWTGWKESNRVTTASGVVCNSGNSLCSWQVSTSLYCDGTYVTDVKMNSYLSQAGTGS